MQAKQKLAEAKNNSLATRYHSSPLPTRSSMYFHKNCITSTNRVIKNVTANGPTKLLSSSLSIFFNYFAVVNDRTKITLSKKERVTIKNTDFFRRKRKILRRKFFMPLQV